MLGGNQGFCKCYPCRVNDERVFLCEQGIKRVTKSWTVKIKR